jgi:hypothetical protein
LGTCPVPLGYIFARLGCETGLILRAIHDAHISWGTYADLLGFHCNSHPNNLVIVPPRSQRAPADQWLAPLDFDMAYQEAQMCRGGKQTFVDVVALERNTMALSIAGDEELNTGAASKAVYLTGSLPTLQWVLRDTMVRHFMAAYERGVRVIDKSLEPQSRAVLGLALIFTSSSIA